MINYLDWPSPSNVKACYTDRLGGLSAAPFDTFNMGLHVGDDARIVQKNRSVLLDEIGRENHIHWLDQVHSIEVVNVDNAYSQSADASYSKLSGQACCVMTADCLPVFLCNRAGTQVAVAHAGWRGLCNGVLQNTVATFQANKSEQQLMAYLGPAIGQSAFEVGEEVRAFFIQAYPTLQVQKFFKKNEAPQKWMADLYGIAKAVLQSVGVDQIYGGHYCTFKDQQAFFSYRRDGKTGRMANLIWLE